MKVLMWFRNDLRVADNTALHAASMAGEVRAVFVAAPAQWRSHDMAPIQHHFIAQNLVALGESLAAFGIPLDVVTVEDYAAAQVALLALCRQHGLSHVFWNREYAINEKRRDIAVEKALRSEGIDCSSFDDQCVVAPGILKNGSGKPYVVFTPFSRAWRAHCAVVPVGLAPPLVKNRDAVVANTVTIGLNTGLTTTTATTTMATTTSATASMAPTTTATTNMGWDAGETAAHGVLTRFVKKRIGSYRERRDFPAMDGTSTLSPYLATGVLSARQCHAAAKRALAAANAVQQESVAAWINELIWRDFYIHIVDAFPDVCRYRAFRTATENVQWRDSDDDFAAWCEGRTGIPIVDAAMRQLVQTGWMHNRLRMIVAMFLSKNLLIDWRRGEKFFMQHLIDGFFPANNGGWQWSASTGTDAAPYFRVFNPVSQGQRFDPDGDFIRRFVPELAHLNSRQVHMPPQDILSSIDYPAPIVDLASSRKRAIEAFAGLK